MIGIFFRNGKRVDFPEDSLMEKAVLHIEYLRTQGAEYSDFVIYENGYPYILSGLWKKKIEGGYYFKVFLKDVFNGKIEEREFYYYA